jgi:hypothetical protein
MISDEDYLDLPEDSELAFLKMEREARALLDKRLENADQSSPFHEFYQEYINSTLAAAHGLGLDCLSHWRTPDVGRENYEEYRAFCLEIERFRTQIRIRHSQYAKKYSVAMERAVKEKIGQHLEQLKKLLAELDISSQKRESIFSKIVALEEELHRERARFEVVADFVLGCATVAGKAGEKLESWRRIVDSVANLIGVAKGKESSPTSLPPPELPKKIEPPKPQLPSPTGNPAGDDIPF